MYDKPNSIPSGWAQAPSNLDLNHHKVIHAECFGEHEIVAFEGLGVFALDSGKFVYGLTNQALSQKSQIAGAVDYIKAMIMHF